MVNFHSYVSLPEGTNNDGTRGILNENVSWINGFFRYLVNCWVSGLYNELVKEVYKQTTLGTHSSFQYLLALW